MSDAQSESRTLRIVAGAGQPLEIRQEAALRHAGQPVMNALTGLLREEATEDKGEAFRALLAERRVVLELSSDSSEGDCVETPLSPGESWDHVLHEIKKGRDVEIGVAISHKGGLPRPGED